MEHCRHVDEQSLVQTSMFGVLVCEVGVQVGNFVRIALRRYLQIVLDGSGPSLQKLEHIHFEVHLFGLLVHLRLLREAIRRVEIPGIHVLSNYFAVIHAEVAELSECHLVLFTGCTVSPRILFLDMLVEPPVFLKYVIIFFNHVFFSSPFVAILGVFDMKLFDAVQHHGRRLHVRVDYS